ncbi:MAG: hypothetical protein COY74_06740 [Nitrosopumilales archaeon CG_4_10_14_0_8_um_filter_34_8]|nr:MAG: hypothetical protein COY74_06740 [Nitrosopumilales archaeon CG_4_10_14_0_8_um_filter_34_8]PJB97623.1 MAG: hypothetical protein CO079_06525 [Nitrosopumilales archaeon CG_4_9_14_0_8_um_filter_34_10]
MSEEKITMDDFVVLGEAVPDEMKDGRKTICTAGYSQKYGLVRIYPVPPNAHLKRWQLIEVPLERNPKDTRNESWKIQGSKDEYYKLSGKITIHDQLTRPKWVSLVNELNAKYGVDCVSDLNDEKLSLGLIQPKSFTPRFEERKTYDSQIQMDLLNPDPFLTVHNYKLQPRITYRCSNCKTKEPHDQQILEWGVYEWLRKNKDAGIDKINEVWKNMHIGESGYHNSFLVGNMAIHRTSFMIISMLRYKLGI